MPKRKPVETIETAPAIAEPKKTARKGTAEKTTSAAGKAAVHKHHAKKTLEPAVATPAAATPIEVTENTVSITHETIEFRAYCNWEARAGQAGSPEQDWFQAEQDLLKLAQNR